MTYARYQDEYAAAWRKSVIAAPKSNNPKPNVLQQSIMAAMADGRERTVPDVCVALYGEKRNRHSVQGALKRLARDGFLASSRFTDGPVNILIYALPHEPRVSCKDRIAAAKREATK